MALSVGDQAPDFSLPISPNRNISLQELKGKVIVLYFYPKDMTPGCTVESCAFQSHYKTLQDLGVEVIGVSKDSLKRHEKFASTYNLSFPLGSDEEGEVCNQYGVWVEKSMFGKKYFGIQRATFLIDAQGQIAHTWPKVKVKGHAEEVLEKVKELKGAGV